MLILGGKHTINLLNMPYEVTFFINDITYTLPTT